MQREIDAVEECKGALFPDEGVVDDFRDLDLEEVVELLRREDALLHHEVGEATTAKHQVIDGVALRACQDLLLEQNGAQEERALVGGGVDDRSGAEEDICLTLLRGEREHAGFFRRVEKREHVGKLEGVKASLKRRRTHL